MADSDDEQIQAEDPGEVDVLGPLHDGVLTFQQDCIEELLKHDGLTVLGQGLGLSTVTAALLAVHHQTTDSGGAVVMVGTAPDATHSATRSCTNVSTALRVNSLFSLRRLVANPAAEYRSRVESPVPRGTAHIGRHSAAKCSRKNGAVFICNEPFRDHSYPHRRLAYGAPAN